MSWRRKVVRSREKVLLIAHAAGRGKLPSPFSTQSDSNVLSQLTDTVCVWKGEGTQHFLATLWDAGDIFLPFILMHLLPLCSFHHAKQDRLVLKLSSLNLQRFLFVFIPSRILYLKILKMNINVYNNNFTIKFKPTAMWRLADLYVVTDVLDHIAEIIFVRTSGPPSQFHFLLALCMIYGPLL